MEDWKAIRIEAGSALIELHLPPGWWFIHPGDYTRDVAEVVETVASRFPPDSQVRPNLTEELRRLARVSAFAGAVLLAGGAATPDEMTGKYAVASLTVLPHEAYLAVDHSEHEPGPSTQFVLDAGAGLRHMWLGPAKTSFGNVLMLSADYVIVPPQPPSWVLAFQTPALERRVEMAGIFDAIVATVRIGHAQAADVAGAFG